jgi:hypothetical protein
VLLLAELLSLWLRCRRARDIGEPRE